jgi:hypothetical protein
MTTHYTTLYYLIVDGYEFMTGYSTLEDARFMARRDVQAGKEVSILRITYLPGSEQRVARLKAS